MRRHPSDPAAAYLPSMVDMNPAMGEWRRQLDGEVVPSVRLAARGRQIAELDAGRDETGMPARSAVGDGNHGSEGRCGPPLMLEAIR